MPEPYYCTVAEFEAETGATATGTKGIATIENAEDVIDDLLGRPTSDPATTGRKVVQTDVEAWQWAKLKRATVKLAAALWANPNLVGGRRWKSESGPDFSFSGPQGSQVGTQVLALLNASGLRNLASRATRGRRLRHESFFAASRHGGT